MTPSEFVFIGIKKKSVTVLPFWIICVRSSASDSMQGYVFYMYLSCYGNILPSWITRITKQSYQLLYQNITISITLSLCAPYPYKHAHTHTHSHACGS